MLSLQVQDALQAEWAVQASTSSVLVVCGLETVSMHGMDSSQFLVQMIPNVPCKILEDHDLEQGTVLAAMSGAFFGERDGSCGG